MSDDLTFYVKLCRTIHITGNSSPDFECVSQFSETSKNIKIVKLVPHFPTCTLQILLGALLKAEYLLLTHQSGYWGPL